MLDRRPKASQQWLEVNLVQASAFRETFRSANGDPQEPIRKSIPHLSRFKASPELLRCYVSDDRDVGARGSHRGILSQHT